MSDAIDAHAVPLSPAATVMLVRDGGDGLEVFMLRRALGASFAGGVYVFPGGRVDAADQMDDLDPICDGLDDGRASARLGIAGGGLAYWVAAIRECFEEAGVLLARPIDSDAPIRFDDGDVASRFDVARRAVHSGERSLAGLCAEEGLLLLAGSVQYVSHWITPIGEPKRFDTRFFVALAPAAQEPLHDDAETIASLWVTPRDALARGAAGELQLYPPTIRNLEFLDQHASSAAALTAGAAIGSPPAIMPRIRFGDDGRLLGVVLPDDADYESIPVPSTVMRGRR
ncbi:MAG: NUDIX hydrolase [Ilumatobacteraceae bacterium]